MSSLELELLPRFPHRRKGHGLCSIFVSAPGASALLQGSLAVFRSPAEGSRKAQASAMQQLSLLPCVHWAAARLAALPGCWTGRNPRIAAQTAALLS